MNFSLYRSWAKVWSTRPGCNPPTPLPPARAAIFSLVCLPPGLQSAVPLATHPAAVFNHLSLPPGCSPQYLHPLAQLQSSVFAPSHPGCNPPSSLSPARAAIFSPRSLTPGLQSVISDTSSLRQQSPIPFPSTRAQSQITFLLPSSRMGCRPQFHSLRLGLRLKCPSHPPAGQQTTNPPPFHPCSVPNHYLPPAHAAFFNPLLSLDQVVYLFLCSVVGWALTEALRWADHHTRTDDWLFTRLFFN
jgi:hypothetical protein